MLSTRRCIEILLVSGFEEPFADEFVRDLELAQSRHIFDDIVEILARVSIRIAVADLEIFEIPSRRFSPPKSIIYADSGTLPIVKWVKVEGKPSLYR